MNIGIIGAGRIGGTVGQLWARAGHDVLFSFSHHPAKLQALAERTGPSARMGTPAEAARFGDVVLLSTPWWAIDEAVAQAGPDLRGKIVVDTTNPFHEGWVPLVLPATTTSGEVNAERLPPATRLVKAYNTLTAVALARESRPGTPVDERYGLMLSGDDADARARVAGLIRDSGFAPVDLGALPNSRLQDPQGPLHNRLMTADQARRIAAEAGLLLEEA